MFGEWLIYAVLAVTCWGLVNILDSYFVESEIYENIFDGMIVSSLFKAFGILAIGGIYFSRTIEISLSGALFSMLGGGLISVAYMAVFAAIFRYNDVSLTQVFWNLSVPLIVILSFFFLGEEFSMRTYIGMAVVFFGALAVSFSKDLLKLKLGKFALLLIFMAVVYAVAEVLLKYVEEGLNVDFVQSFPFVCLGQVSFGIILLLFRTQTAKKIVTLIGSNWRLFFFGETLELFGLFFMQLAIVKTPAVSYFGVVETFMPIAVIVLTGALIFFLKLLRRGETLKKVYEENMLVGLPYKIVATVIMMIGVYLIG